MQTLNVGAGRTETEYKEAQEQQRADLREESRSAADLFFWAAGLAAVGTGLLPIRLNILLSVGAYDLLRAYERSHGSVHVFTLYGLAAAWVVTLIGLGFAGRHGHRWAFLAGMALYGADMVALMLMFSIWSFGIHAFFVFKWFQGLKALKDLREPVVAAA